MKIPHDLRSFVQTFVVQLLLETLRGKDSYRWLSNRSLSGLELYGAVLDIGGGKKRGSHYRYLSSRRPHTIRTVDIDPLEEPDIVADVSKDLLPVDTNSIDTVLCMNVLEHVSDVHHTLAEVQRVLKPGGVVYAVIPFLVRVHPTPADYRRLTSDGIRSAFESAGLTCGTITPFGAGPFLAAHSQLEMLLPRVVRLLTLPLALLCDTIVSALRPATFSRASYPLGYAIVARKVPLNVL